MSEAAKPNTLIYLVEDIWYDSYSLLGAYQTEEQAIAFVRDPNIIKQHGDWRTGKTSLHIREIGVRQRVTLRPVHSREVLPETYSSY